MPQPGWPSVPWLPWPVSSPAMKRVVPSLAWKKQIWALMSRAGLGLVWVPSSASAALWMTSCFLPVAAS
jgi:hypothetical protein